VEYQDRNFAFSRYRQGTEWHILSSGSWNRYAKVDLRHGFAQDQLPVLVLPAQAIEADSRGRGEARPWLQSGAGRLECLVKFCVTLNQLNLDTSRFLRWPSLVGLAGLDTFSDDKRDVVMTVRITE
jgi:hypothetical protein